LCDQKGSWDGQLNPSSYYSTSEILFQDEAAYSQSENSFLQQQFPLNSNAFVGDYKKNYDSQIFSITVPPHIYFLKIQLKRNQPLD